MRIIENLKKFFNIRQEKEQKYLPSGQENIRDKYRVQQLPNIPKEPTLEECMEEFIKQYSFQEDINSGSSNKSYNAFRRMFCDQEEEVRT